MLMKYLSYLHAHASRCAWETIWRLLEEEGPREILLDCGCSDGKETVKIAEHIHAKKVFGIELDAEAAKEARKKGVIVYESDLNRKFPLEYESVDVVFSNQVIEHLVNVDNFVKESFRVLKPGGYTVLCTPNLASWHNIFALISGKQPYTGPWVSLELDIEGHPARLEICEARKCLGNIKNGFYCKHNTVIACRTLKKLFKSWGFKDVKIIGSGYYPFFGLLSKALARLDVCHSTYLTLKAHKKRETRNTRDSGVKEESSNNHPNRRSYSSTGRLLRFQAYTLTFCSHPSN